MDGVSGRGKYIALAVLLLPSLIGMGIFYIFPIISSFVLSFSKWDLLTPIQWIGFDNYIAAAQDPVVQQALRNTLFFILGYLP
ncbi:MAG: sugar ABC transporter permease, partial [Devosia sp.]